MKILGSYFICFKVHFVFFLKQINIIFLPRFTMDFQLDTEKNHQEPTGSGSHASHKASSLDMDAVKKDMKLPPFSFKGIDWKKELENVIELYKGTPGKVHEIIEAPHNLSVAVGFIFASALATGLGLYFAYPGFVGIGYVLGIALSVFITTIASFVITGLLARQVFHVKQNAYSFLKLGGYLNVAQVVQIIPGIGTVLGLIMLIWALVIFYRAARDEFKLSVRDIILLIIIVAVVTFVLNFIFASIFGLRGAYVSLA